MLVEHAWDRKFGEPLPTLEDVMKEADDDDRYVHVGYGRYKEKDTRTGEPLPNSPTYIKKDSGGFEMVDDDDPRLSKGDDKEEPKGKGAEPGDFERDFGGDTGTDADFQGEPPEGAREPDDVDDDEPDDRARARGRDDVPKEPLARGTKVTASWKGLSGKQQEIPDGEIEDIKYSDKGHEVEYVIRWNNGSNLIKLPADYVKSEEPEVDGPSPEDGDWDSEQVMTAKLDGEEVGDIIDQGEDHPNYDKAMDYVLQFDPDDEKLYTGTGWKGHSGAKDETVIINGKKYKAIKESVSSTVIHPFKKTYKRIGEK